jgi:hypothetical protein
MFTRSELEIKTIEELGNLCRRYGIKPTGNIGYKLSHITALMAFPVLPAFLTSSPDPFASEVISNE